MAAIWFVKESDVQKGSAVASQPLDWCVSKLDVRPDNWVTDLATKKLTIGKNMDAELAPNRRCRSVLLQIGDDDLTGSGGKDWKRGFHLVDMDAMTAKNLFER